MEQWHWLMVEMLGLAWAGYELYSLRQYKRRDRAAAEAAKAAQAAPPPNDLGIRNGNSD